MTLTLYHNNMSTCSQKVRLALAETGVNDWDSVELDLRAGDQFDPDYAELNPNNVVPTLVHGSATIIESTVINEYIIEAFGGDLRPRDPVQAAAMRLWTKQLDEGLHASTGTLSFAIAFRHQLLDQPSDVLDRALAAMPQARRKGMEALLELGTEVPTFPGAVRRFERLLTDMDTALTSRRWLAGNDYSLADVAYTPYLTRLEHLALSAWWDTRPHVAEWYDRIRQRPSYPAAVGDWTSESYLTLMADKGAEVWPKIQSMIR
jgi:glutathione S-transferase